MPQALPNKEFDSWNDRKKSLDSKNSPADLYFHEGDIWWCAVGLNVGVEMDGKNHDFERPVLIIKKFNRMMFWGIPLTSKSKVHPYVLELKHDRGRSFVRLAQLRLFSSKRIFRKLGMADAVCFSRVLHALKNCF